MAQMPGQRPQATHADRMQFAASLESRSPRAVMGAPVSNLSTAVRKRSRHFRFCPADAAIKAETASNPASCTTTIAKLHLRVKLARYTREWGMNFYNYHPRLNTDHPEIIQAA